jgi:hypothetical protein
MPEESIYTEAFIHVPALLWFAMHEQGISEDVALAAIEQALSKRFDPARTDTMKRAVMNEIVGLHNDALAMG